MFNKKKIELVKWIKVGAGREKGRDRETIPNMTTDVIKIKKLDSLKIFMVKKWDIYEKILTSISTKRNEIKNMWEPIE